jgi:glycerophosphoryl diester phosphodiesterase
MGDQVLLMSFEHRRIAEAKKLRPRWEMGVLVAVAVGNILRLEADFYAVPVSVATRGLIRAAHRRGREVHVWTVDDPLRMSALVSRGVDNLITGYPAVARDVMAEREALGPVERLLIDLAADFGVVRLRPAPPGRREDA